jgi:hypothetical protein
MYGEKSDNRVLTALKESAAWRLRVFLLFKFSTIWPIFLNHSMNLVPVNP